MLRCCWDWLSGSVDDRSRRENGVEQYGANGSVPLTGSQRAPPWPPQRLNQIMFILPAQLANYDEIYIRGTLRPQWSRIKVSLVTGDQYPDYGNVAYAVDAESNGQYRVEVTKNNRVDLKHTGETSQSGLISDDSTLEVKISANNGLNQLTVALGDNAGHDVSLEHRLEEIRFLALEGDIVKVDSLTFMFKEMLS